LPFSIGFWCLALIRAIYIYAAVSFQKATYAAVDFGWKAE
jgi:hypothetical protein